MVFVPFFFAVPTAFHRLSYIFTKRANASISTAESIPLQRHQKRPYITMRNLIFCNDKVADVNPPQDTSTASGGPG
eukprot:SAG31_NODE_3566_length_4119_cov_2.312935_3_plen_76_part_00